MSLLMPVFHGGAVVKNLPTMQEMPVPHRLDYCGLTVCLKLGSVSSSTLFFFLKIILAIPGPLHFHRNFRISLEKPAEILVGVRLKL